MSRRLLRFTKHVLIDSNFGGTSMIYLAVLGVFILGAIYQLMTTHDTNLTSDRAFTQNIEVDTTMEEIKMYLRSKQSCKASFAGKMIGDTVTDINFFGLTGSSYMADTNHPISTGNLIPVFLSQLTLSNIKIDAPNAAWSAAFRSTPYAPSSKMFTAFIVFTFTKGTIISLRGRSEITRILPLEVALRPDNKIETCFFDSDSAMSRWVFDACSQLFEGTIMQAHCAHINVKRSLSTEGHYCLNAIDGNEFNPGDIHNKDCINSWYFQTRTDECHWLPTSGRLICDEDEVMVGFTSHSCGKNCVKANGLCCKARLNH